jgi:hypothetical protein
MWCRGWELTTTSGGLTDLFEDDYESEIRVKFSRIRLMTRELGSDW